MNGGGYDLADSRRACSNRVVPVGAADQGQARCFGALDNSGSPAIEFVPSRFDRSPERIMNPYRSPATSQHGCKTLPAIRQRDAVDRNAQG